MKNYIGILGDPAKAELYDSDFYRILDWDTSRSSFHLLGASENDVSRSDYRQMYDNFSSKLRKSYYSPIPNLSKSDTTSFSSRIGLFPSSTSHLIKGPSFTFAPFPVNSSSTYLKIKSSLLQFLLKPFLPFVLRKLAYVPLGGKAAMKTQADNSIGEKDLPMIFKELREKDKFDWYYLEAGSGQEFLDNQIIDDVLNSQLPPNIDRILNEQDLEYGSRIILPRFIYGGGIRNIEQLDSVIGQDPSGIKFIPEIVIVGNISEENIDQTYDLISKVGELNEVPTYNLSTLLQAYNYT